MDLPDKLYISETDYIDFERGMIITEETQFELSAQQYCILEYMVINKNIVLSQEKMVDYLCKKNFAPSTVTNLIKDLRKYGNLKNCIQTRKGLGYVFKIPDNINQIEDRSSQDEKSSIKFSDNETDDSETENAEFDTIEEIDFDEKPSKDTRIKKLLSLLIPIILIISIVTGVFLGNYTSFKMKDNIYHITVSKPANMTEEDCNILEERVKIFSDGKKYSVDIENDKIELYLPANAFCDNDIKYVLDCYLTRSTKLYAYNFKNKDKSEAVFIERKDIESVSVLDGPIDGIDASQYGIGSSEYKYFSIVLTDEFINANKDKLAEFGNDFAFAQDMENDLWYTYYTFPQNDGKTFYVLNNDTNNNFVNILEYNLTHKSLSFDLNDYVIDINSKAEWQDVSSINNPGVNQCNSDKFTEGTITFSLSAFDLLSEGKEIDTEKALKQRLDSLGNKYAFGSYNSENKTVYVIKTTMNNINLPVMKILCNAYGYYTIQSGLSQYDLNNSSIAITSDPNGNKISFLSNSYDEYEKEKLLSFTESLNNSNEDKIYMMIDGMPLLCTNINNIDITTGTISFDQICQIADGEIICNSIGNEFSYLLEIFKTISEAENIMESLHFDNYQFNVSKRGNLPTTRDFNLQYSYYNEEIANKIKEICPTAAVGMEGLRISVSLNLPVDDNLVSSSIENAKNIYNSIDLENSMYESLSIYFIDENDEVMERGRIFFNKQYSSYYSDGYIYTHGIFVNGRLEKYKDDFKTTIENDEFINSFSQDEFSWKYSMN